MTTYSLRHWDLLQLHRFLGRDGISGVQLRSLHHTIQVARNIDISV